VLLRGWTHFRPLLTTRREILRRTFDSVNIEVVSDLALLGLLRSFYRSYCSPLVRPCHCRFFIANYQLVRLVEAIGNGQLEIGNGGDVYWPTK
jgi:hypothetical protein